jgi:hypothetical protein
MAKLSYDYTTRHYLAILAADVAAGRLTPRQAISLANTIQLKDNGPGPGQIMTYIPVPSWCRAYWSFRRGNAIRWALDEISTWATLDPTPVPIDTTALAPQTASAVAPCPQTAAGGAGQKPPQTVTAGPSTQPSDHYLHRPYIRKWVRDAVEAAAPRAADGRPIDPNTRQPIDGTPDLGHTPGVEFWRERDAAEGKGMSQQEFNDQMNDPSKYQLEDPSSNRSHQYEQP